jgi:hypothetical protein
VKKGNRQRPMPFMVARWRGREERQGVLGSAPRGGREAGKRGGPGRGGGQLGHLTSAPGRWARTATLLRDRGGRWGAGDTGVSG